MYSYLCSPVKGSSYNFPQVALSLSLFWTNVPLSASRLGGNESTETIFGRSAWLVRTATRRLDGSSNLYTTKGRALPSYHTDHLRIAAHRMNQRDGKYYFHLSRLDPLIAWYEFVGINSTV